MADASAGSLLSPGIIEPPPKRRRFSEPQKFLPVAFVSCTICFLWTVYVYYHCCPMLQLGAWRRPGPVDRDARWRGLVEVVVFHYLTAMLLICYVRSILMHPGDIPENDPQWEYQPQDGRCSPNWVPMGLQEMKRTGLRRHCKWCGKYKPDRCHHCRVCKTCILKMDHHCPWIYNCVGFRNHKFFFLLLFYAAIDCHFIAWTMLETVKSSVDNSTPFTTMFFLLFGETLSAFLGVLVTIFFGFHVWLMFKSMTTIEFCEKAMKKTGYSSAYSRGALGNVQAVLGDAFLLWLLPFNTPSGRGLHFVGEDSPLVGDVESAQGSHRKSQHKAGYGSARKHSSGKARKSARSGQSSAHSGGEDAAHGEAAAAASQDAGPRQ